MSVPSFAAGHDVLLVHSSDLHVEDPLPGLAAPPLSGLAGLSAVLDAARHAAADIVLLAGDTFDHHRVSNQVLRRAAALLATAGRPVILLPGNHDAALPDDLFHRAGLLELPHIAVLGITHSDAVLFSEHELEIWGRAHRGGGSFVPLTGPRPRITRWQVAMAHGHYVPSDEWHEQAHRAWRISDADLAACGADYVALGHWDRPMRVGGNAVRAYYSGSPDLAGTMNLVLLGGDGTVTVERRPVQHQVER